MSHLPAAASDEELIAFVDEWVAFLECEDYVSAYSHILHYPEDGWSSADLLRDAIKLYGDQVESQRATLDGVPSDISQRKEVSRWPKNAQGAIGEIWYDLNIDGVASDLTATFRIVEVVDGLDVYLNAIHVM